MRLVMAPGPFPPVLEERTAAPGAEIRRLPHGLMDATEGRLSDRRSRVLTHFRTYGNMFLSIPWPYAGHGLASKQVLQILLVIYLLIWAPDRGVCQPCAGPVLGMYLMSHGTIGWQGHVTVNAVCIIDWERQDSAK